MPETLEIVDLEQMLSDELGCQICDNGAEYMSKMRCCDDKSYLCAVCVARARAKFAAIAPTKCQCGRCKTPLGWRHAFDEVATVVEI